ncbi:MAG: Carbamoyl-phosphate synthase chain, ATP-binding, partial [Proteobacteria bacterium]|nr:Carbamoyl-phosphate synthase chain, ATP-binding [Pseudomonadota bacterium]
MAVRGRKPGGSAKKTEALLPLKELTPVEAEARRTQLKNLIILGKERGFLTYAEINDHLPDEVLDADQIEGVISMINDMGIQVYDEAPDAETLLMQEAAPAVADEDVVAEAEQALTTVDSEFGRTTDPVRMYMREMGSVDLLTREGEIEIAKRIEEGLRHMVQAISSCPLTIQQILDMATQVEKDELRIDELIDGFVEVESEAAAAEPVSPADDDEADEEDEDASAAVAAANLAQLKAEALAQFDFIRKAYKKSQNAHTKYGLGSPQHMKAQAEVTELLMAIRFSVRQVDNLCEQIRNAVEEVRSHERKIMEFCVTRSGMPRPHFIKAFPGNETNLAWLDREIAAKKAYCSTLSKVQYEVKAHQEALIAMQERVG